LNEPHLDRFGGDLDPRDLPVHNRANGLDVGFELPGRDARALGAHAAKVLGLAAMSLLIPDAGLLAGKVADARHIVSFDSPKKSS